MQLSFIFLLSTLFLGLVHGGVLFTRNSAPSGWTLGNHASPSTEVTFIIALKQQNIGALENLFWAVSDPSSPLYQSFQSIDDINAIIAPKSENINAVKQWLLNHGIYEHNIDTLGDALEVRTNVKIASKLFNTKMYEFTHTESGRTLVRQFGSYSVPDSISEVIDMISGISTFPIPHQGYKRVVISAAALSTDMGIIPQTVYQLYNFSGEGGNGTSGNFTTPPPFTTIPPFNTTTSSPFTTTTPKLPNITTTTLPTRPVNTTTTTTTTPITTTTSPPTTTTSTSTAGIFSLRAFPEAITFPVGSIMTFALIVTQNIGLGSEYVWELTGLPFGVSGEFSPALGVGSGVTTLQLDISGYATTGTYNLQIYLLSTLSRASVQIQLTLGESSTVSPVTTTTTTIMPTTTTTTTVTTVPTTTTPNTTTTTPRPTTHQPNSTSTTPFPFTTTPHPGNGTSNGSHSHNHKSFFGSQIWGHQLRMTTELDHPITSQGVIEFSFETFMESDLQTFSSQTGIPIPPVPQSQIVGNGQGFAQIESTLDIEMIAGVNPSASNWFWLEDGENWLYAFAVHFYNTTNIPQVISISYGWWEGDQCNDYIFPGDCSAIGVDSQQYVERVNTEFLKIGLRGVSIIVSSGDSGAHTRTDESCTAPTLRAEFPASSPYVTAVGATQLVSASPLAFQPQICSIYTCAASGYEEAVSFSTSFFTSGGGFSEYSAQPSYQTSAVSSYFKSGVLFPPSSYYNRTKRAIPDVASIGHNNLIIADGFVEPVGGTSASAPIFAAIISKLNQESVFQTGSPLGFLNPLLYKMWSERPNTFNDITVGDNICTESGCFSSCTGWYAAKGWDPVTGLGTPNFGNMLDYITKLNQHNDRTLLVL